MANTPDTAPNPIATPNQAPAAPAMPIPEALDTITQGEVFDAYRRRLRGTAGSVLGGVGKVASKVAGGAIVGFYGAVEGWPEGLAIDGPVATVGMLAVSGAVHLAHQHVEKKRAQRSETAEQVIRNDLSEPVDLFRNTRRKHKGELTLRWYGADVDYEQEEDPELIDRFRDVVSFAEDHKLKHVVVAERLLHRSGAKIDLKKYRHAETDTQKLLKELKPGAKLTDKLSESMLLHLTTAEARQLAGELQSSGAATRIDVLAEWLIKLRRHEAAEQAAAAATQGSNIAGGKQHNDKPARTTSAAPDNEQKIIDPFEEKYKAWKANGHPDNYRPTMAKLLHGKLAQHFESNDDNGVVKVNHVKVPVSRQIEINGMKVTFRYVPRGVESREHTSVEVRTLAQLVGATGGDMDMYVDELLKHRREKVLPQDRYKIEVALYYLLNRQKADKTAVEAVGHASGVAQNTPDTLMQRVHAERPRTRGIWAGLRKRGKVAKSDQTVEYRRTKKRTWGKVLAAAGALAIGLGAGAVEGFAEQQGDFYLNTLCKPEIASGKKLDKACDTALVHFLENDYSVTTPAVTWQNHREDSLLLYAYTHSLVTEKQFPQIQSLANKKWAKQRENDIEKRVNVYGDNKSQIGDAAQGDSAATVWDLDPKNGASTEGYWPTSVQDLLNVDFEDTGSSYLLPYSNLSLELQSKYKDTVSPIGSEADGFDERELVRKLDIPKTPEQSSVPLIGVHGRQLAKDAATITYGTTVTGGREYITVPVPVLIGSDIVGADLTLKNLGTNKVVSHPNAVWYQDQSGIFHAAFPEQYITDQSTYIDINYWIQPNDSKALPLKAKDPIEINTFRYNGSPFLSEMLSPENVAPLFKELGLAPDATAGQVADAIRLSHKYSFTPYADSGQKPTIDASQTLPPVVEALLNVAEQAEKLNAEDCNMAAYIELITERGKDGDRFLNGAVGFHNTDGSNGLTTEDSHQWIVGSVSAAESKNNPRAAGELIDPTPTASAKLRTPKIDKFQQEKAKPASDSSNGIGEDITALMALTTGLFAGRKLSPKVAKWVHEQRIAGAKNWIMHNQQMITILDAFICAPDGTVIDVEKLKTPRPASPGSQRTDHLVTVPSLSRNALDAIVLQRTQQGVKISKQDQQLLGRLVDKAAIVRKG
jgi:hypothetical protein